VSDVVVVFFFFFFFSSPFWFIFVAVTTMRGGSGRPIALRGLSASIIQNPTTTTTTVSMAVSVKRQRQSKQRTIFVSQVIVKSNCLRYGWKARYHRTGGYFKYQLTDVETRERQYVQTKDILYTNPFVHYTGCWRRVLGGYRFEVSGVSRAGRKSMSANVIVATVKTLLPPFELNAEEHPQKTRALVDRVCALVKEHKTHTKTTKYPRGTDEATRWLRCIMDGAWLSEIHYTMVRVYGVERERAMTEADRVAFASQPRVSLVFLPHKHVLRLSPIQFATYFDTESVYPVAMLSKAAAMCLRIKKSRVADEVMYINDSINDEVHAAMLNYGGLTWMMARRAMCKHTVFPVTQRIHRSCISRIVDCDLRDDKRCVASIRRFFSQHTDKMLVVGGEATCRRYKDKYVCYYGGRVDDVTSPLGDISPDIDSVVVFLDTDMNPRCMEAVFERIGLGNLMRVLIIHDSNLVTQKGTYRHAMAASQPSLRTLSRIEQRVDEKAKKKHPRRHSNKWTPDTTRPWSINRPIMSRWEKLRYRKWPIHASFTLMTIDEGCFPVLPKWIKEKHEDCAPYAVVIVPSVSYRDAFIQSLAKHSPWRQWIMCGYQLRWNAVRHVLSVCDSSDRTHIYTTFNISTQSTTLMTLVPPTTTRKLHTKRKRKTASLLPYVSC